MNKNYRMAKFININGKYVPYTNDTDLIKLQSEEIERLKNDLINLLRIIDKNCDDLEGTEEEFDSLDRVESLLKELKEGK